MSRSRPFGAKVAIGIVVGTLTSSRPAAAQQTADFSDPSRASAQFDAATLAVKANRFADAAVLYESAYLAAAHPQALENAIRMHQRVGALARAATLSAIGEKRYPNDLSLLSVTGRVLAAANKSLGRIDITCTPACSTRVDGVPSFGDKIEEEHVVYVEPGRHGVEARFVGAPIEARSVDTAAGVREALTIRPTPEGGQPVVRADDRPFPKGVFFAGLGLTVVGIGVTIGFYVDQKRVENDELAAANGCADPNCPSGNEGRAARSKTIISGVVTGLVGLGTAAIGLFGTRWSTGDPPPPKTPTRAHLQIAPVAAPVPHGGWAGVSGRF